MKWKNVPPILLILWPYLIILSFLFPNEDMLTLFLNIYLLLTFPVYLLNILYTCTYKAEDALTHLAIWNMIIKLAHIPFYGLVFLLGACMMLTMVVPALALVAPLAALLLMIVDLLLMLTSSAYGIRVLIRARKLHLISEGFLLIHLICHFCFVADVISAFIMRRKLKNLPIAQNL